MDKSNLILYNQKLNNTNMKMNKIKFFWQDYRHSLVFQKKFFLLTLTIFLIIENASGQNPKSKSFSPYADYTVYKTNTSSYGHDNTTKIGYCPTGGQTYKIYRKALNFSIGSIPSNSTITSSTLSFSSGYECGNYDGIIKFTKIRWDFPTLFDDKDIYDLVNSGSQITTIAISSEQTYNASLASLLQDIQNAIQSSYPNIGLAGYNTEELNMNGTSFSNIVLTINYTIPTPPAVTNLNISSKTSSGCILSWTAPSGNVTGYKIYVNNTLNNTTSSTNCSISGLCPGTSYSFKVVAYNSYGDGDPATISGSTKTTYISGQSLICNSANYTLCIQDCPPNNGITWTKSSNINYVSGQGTENFVINSSSSGSGWVKATFTPSSGNCGIMELLFGVWFGPPVVTISGPSEGYLGNSYTFYENPVAGSPTSFEWTLNPPYDGNNIYNYDYWANAAFYGYPGYFQIGCTPSNSCGTGSMATTYIDIYENLSLSISPNPASSEITVRVKQNTLNQSEDTVNDLNFEVSIYNMYGIIQSKKKYIGSEFSIPVNNLREGNYIIRFENGKSIITKQLIIKH